VIFGVPHGAQFAADRRTLIWPETGAVAEPIVQEPFKGTPALTDRRDHNDQRTERERERFEITEAEVPENLVRMDAFVRKRDNDDGQGPAGVA
jgi:hypothetical protein